ncbi:hypothetical protein EC957_007040 [Mortierella hygrophila]|uniref:Uncharacterized protein n=1 Tax=Mortierella hygrophila TaxID=979708 RepID=A0A9P6JYT3_9FUNG|nr:hypothetical protein EC957_007040 [Mortierella hygrophila]
MMMVLQSSTVAVTAIGVMNLPPSHIDLCPDAYLFEFMSEPGTAAAAEEANQFKAKIASMKSAHIRQEFGFLINGISVQVTDQDELLELMTLGILQTVTPLTIVSPPEQVQPRQNVLVTSALNMTGVTRVHAELGLTGHGVKVGVIDTGIDYTHPALGGCFGPGCKVAYGYDFVGNNYTGKNTPVSSSDPMDCAGHGSHVAGIIGASDDIVTGVAPKVLLGAYRVLGCSGSANDDVIIAALERAAKDKMDVINLSIGEPNGWSGNPVTKAIGRMQDKGIMVAVSQGNENTQGLLSTNYVAIGSGVLSVASFINTRALLTSFTISLAPERFFIFKKPDHLGLDRTLPLVALLNGTDLGIACEPIKDDLTGKTVLVLRGGCEFVMKAQNALAKGATGILFANNQPGSLSADIKDVKILSGAMSQQDGQLVLSYLKSIPPPAAGGGSLTGETTASFSKNPTTFVNPAGGTMSLFSSYGLDNELHIKPDIGAPGENIYSTWPVVNGSYTTLSGTSMASPHIAGALALAIERLRNLDANGLGKEDASSSSPATSTLDLTAAHIQRIYATFKNTAEPAYVFRNHMKYDILTDPTAKIPGTDAKQDPGASSPDLRYEHGDGGEGGEGRAYVESVAKQGSGMANIYRALTSLAYKVKPELAHIERAGDVPPISLTNVFPAMLELNDTAAAELEFSGKGGRRGGQTRYITISNYGPNPVRYELSHISAEGLFDLSMENKETKLRNLGIFNVTNPADSDVDDVKSAEAKATVEFAGLEGGIKVPGGGGQRRVAVTIFPPTGIPEDQHWIYSGYIVVRAVSSSSSISTSLVTRASTDSISGETRKDGETKEANSNPAGDYFSSSTSPSPPPPDVIHVSYAGVVGKMKTLPIFLRPTGKELQVNNQTALCQMMGSGANRTDFIYTFNGTDIPILTFCIQNPTKYLVMDLISAPPEGSEQVERDNNNNDPDGAVDPEDYQVIGRVAANENLGRSVPASIVTAVQWDGTLDLLGGDGKNRSQEFVPTGESRPLRHSPGLDLVYGMRAHPEGEEGESSTSQLQSARDQSSSSSGMGGRDARLLERRNALDPVVKRKAHIDEDGTSTTNDGDGDNKDNGKSKKKSRKEASEVDDANEDGDNETAQARNDRLLRNYKKKAKLAAAGADPKQIQLVVPNGRYRLRIRALRILADPGKAEGYDYWITRTFTIQRIEPATTISTSPPPLK